MSALIVGLAILLGWPLFNVGLATYATRVTATRVTATNVTTTQAAAAGASTGRGRRPPSRRPPSRRPPSRRAAAPDPAPPATYWLVIPCLNEARVVARTVRAALGCAAGPAEVQVLVIDDGSDDGTGEVLAALRTTVDHRRLHVLRRNPPIARQGKGAALNAGYRFIRHRVTAAGADPTQVVVGIIDADGRATENLLTEVAEAMRDPKVGAVQVRVRIRNRGRLLGMAQDLEFGSVADASQVVRDRFGSVGLGGNGQFIRLSVLAALGPAPWSDCLVEDLELGLRIHLAGVRIRYVWRAAVAQQGLVDVRRLLRQRTRWAQGNLQCIRYLAALFADRRLRNHTFMEMSYYLLAPWFNAVGAVVVAGFWGYTATRVALGSSLLSSAVVLAVVMAVWLAVMVIPGLLWAVIHWYRLREDRLGHCLLGGLTYPVLLMIGLLSTWRAVGRQLAGRRGWVKTERLRELSLWLPEPTQWLPAPLPAPLPAAAHHPPGSAAVRAEEVATA